MSAVDSTTTTKVDDRALGEPIEEFEFFGICSDNIRSPTKPCAIIFITTHFEDELYSFFKDYYEGNWGKSWLERWYRRD